VEQAAKLAFAFRYPYATLQNLVGLGRVEMAYEYLRKSNYTVAQFRNGDTDVLFRVTMRPFIFDRRFMAFADRVGLLRYWQSSGNWPDFCADRDIPYNCRAETDRLHVAG
jgi:hypothetical protein